MALKIEGIPQRETLGDVKRDALMAAMVKKGEDPSLLPITPATVIAYGRIGGGKSSIMYSWLKNMFPRYYDEVLIFCGSSDSKKAFEGLPQKRIVFMTEYDNEAFTHYIDKLKEDQIERMEKKERPLNIFIGFDDVVFAEAMSSKGKPTMAERVILICRHELNATVFICVQHSKQVNAAMRNNTLYNVILPLQKNDLVKVAEEHAGHLSTEEFCRMYYNIMAKGKHEFIVVDYKAPEARRFRHGFDKIITFGTDEPAAAVKELAETRGPSVRGPSDAAKPETDAKKPECSKAPCPGGAAPKDTPKVSSVRKGGPE